MKLKNETTTLDRETGEIVTMTKTFSTKVNQDEFFMMYVNLMSPQFGLKSPKDKDLLIRFCMMAQYNTGKISLTTADRKMICESLEMLPQNLSRSINNLKHANLLTGEEGSYFINPEFFWKGTNDVRNKMLKEKKLSLTFEFEK